MSILKQIQNCLKDMGLEFNVFEKDQVITMALGGNHGSFMAMFQVINNCKLIIHSISNMKAKKEKRQIISEFLTRSNRGLSIGNWEFDMDDGKIMFKTSMPVVNPESNDLREAIEILFVINISTFDKYMSGIMKIIYSDISAKKAIEEIRNPDFDKIMGSLIKDVLKENN